MMFTALSASGVSFYESWKKLRDINLLPKIKEDADGVIRQVDVLGHDPLIVMQDKAEQTKSKAF